MITTLLLAAAQPAEQPVEMVRTDCTYDLEAMLALDRNAFDQDLDGGWREVQYRGCYEAAAELIRKWRHEKRDHTATLYWHEGQMRANAGQTGEAIGLFKLTYKSPVEDTDFGWNYYVDGTIAFLTRDRKGLAEAMANLRRIPLPEELSVTLPDGKVVTPSWPPNLNVLEGFELCWERSYREAYSQPDCSAPISL